MSDMNATVQQTKNGFHVEGVERISYDFTFLDGVFNVENPQLAECYKTWGRALAVTDQNVYDVYGQQIEEYFNHHDITLKVHKTKIGEKAKTIPTWASIADSMTEFGIYRKVLAFPIFVSLFFTRRDSDCLPCMTGACLSCGRRTCHRCCWVKKRLARDYIKALSHQSHRSRLMGFRVTC